MNTNKNDSKITSSNSTKETLFNKSTFTGILFGLLLAGSFWAGHEFYPKIKPETKEAHETKSSEIIVGEAVQLLPKDSPIMLGSNPNVIANIAQEATPSVVNIDTTTSIAIHDINPFHQFGFDFYFGGEFPGPNQNEQEPRIRKYESKGMGSGVIINSDGYILTNNHVIQKADEIKVTLRDKRVFKGKVIGKDNFTDLALIKIEAQNLKPAKLGQSKNIRPGDWAIAIGSPLGLSQTVTLGIVSALGRSLSNVNSVELIQTDAAINPGNSGGPLLNINGEVIGINSAIRTDGQNIGFAVPIDIAKTISQEIMKNGNIKHPYLGISMQDLDAKLAKFLGLTEKTKGVVIAKISANSPAEKSGLLQGDLIQSIDGKAVTTAKEIQTIVRSHKADDSLNFLVIRNRSLTAITVRIGNYEDLHQEQN